MASCRARRPFSRRSEARRSGEGLLPGPAGLPAGPHRGAGTVSGREGDLQASTGGVHEEMPPCRSRLRRRRPPGTRPPPRPRPRSLPATLATGHARYRPRSLPATLATDRNGAAPKRPFVFVFTGSCPPASTWPLPRERASLLAAHVPSSSRTRRSTSDAQRLPKPVSHRPVSHRPVSHRPISARPSLRP